MSEQLQEYAKPLKLTHLSANFTSFTTKQVAFLEDLFEQEIEQREASCINLLLK